MLNTNLHYRTKDLTGQRFGKLYVVDFAFIKNNLAWWNCICDCGNSKVVCGRQLTASPEKGTRSCGCLHTRPFGVSAKYETLHHMQHGAKIRGYCWKLQDNYAFE